MKMNVLRISVLVTMIISFAACNYRYNVEKMRADMEAAWENEDDETYNRLSKRLDEINNPKITPNDMVNAVVEHFSFTLNIDRMIDDFEKAIQEQNGEQIEYLSGRLSELYNDKDSQMNDDQMEKFESLMTDSGEY